VRCKQKLTFIGKSCVHHWAVRFPVSAQSSDVEPRSPLCTAVRSVRRDSTRPLFSKRNLFHCRLRVRSSFSAVGRLKTARVCLLARPLHHPRGDQQSGGRGERQRTSVMATRTANARRHKSVTTATVCSSTHSLRARAITTRCLSDGDRQLCRRRARR
jgi:hypothetical protein